MIYVGEYHEYGGLCSTIEEYSGGNLSKMGQCYVEYMGRYNEHNGVVCMDPL